MMGRCYCGDVRFTCARAPLRTRTCWCRDCQYLACGNATNNLVFAAEVVTVTGAVTDYESVADSGHRMRRSFCGRCGTQLFSRDLGEPGFVVVRAGALDEREVARPEAAIWVASAPGWACFDPAVPRFAGHVPAVGAAEEG